MYIPIWGLVVLVVLIFWSFSTRASRTALDEMAISFENTIKGLEEKREQLQQEAEDLRTELDTL